MIVDVHRHMWSAGQRYRKAFVGLPAKYQRPETDFKWESAAAEAVTEMEGAGVDKSVIIVADFEARLGPSHFPIEIENDLVAKAAQRYPDRLIPFFGIDPRRPGAAERFERAIGEGVRGLKLHPAVGFHPYDAVCTPLYELCIAHGLPVLAHVAPAFHPRLYSRYAHPLEYDQVAGDFPDLLLIMAHAGGEWWKDALAVAQGHPNMVLEVSEWQPLLRDEPAATVGAIDRMRNVIGIERIVWASDFPGKRLVVSLKESVDLYRDLPALGRRHGYTFTESDVELLLGSNAARLLNIA